MSHYCHVCGYEKPEKGEAITLYEGKLLCDCDNGNTKGKKIKLSFKKKESKK